MMDDNKSIIISKVESELITNNNNDTSIKIVVNMILKKYKIPRIIVANPTLYDNKNNIIPLGNFTNNVIVFRRKRLCFNFKIRKKVTQLENNYKFKLSYKAWKETNYTTVTYIYKECFWEGDICE